MGVPGQAAAIQWTNTSGGNWSVAANWSPNQVPGPADGVYITNSGTYVVTLDVDATVGSLSLGKRDGSVSDQVTLVNTDRVLTLGTLRASVVGLGDILNLSGGTVTGTIGMFVNGTVNNSGGNIGIPLLLTNGGTLNWTGGEISAEVTLASNGLMNISGSGQKNLSALLNNAGTVTWTGSGALYVQQIVNLPGAIFDVQQDQDVYGWGTTQRIENRGLFRKSAGTGTSTINVPFLNTGTVDVQTGTLNFQSGGQFGSVFNAAAGTAIQLNGGGNLTGTFTAAAGATISLGGGAFTYAPSLLFNGAGVHQLVGGSITLLNEVIPNLQLVGGTVWLSPSFQGGSITNLTLPGVTLAGTNVVTGTFNCGGGASGSLLVVGGATLNWTDGTISGELTVAQNGVLSLVGSSQKNLGGLLFNAGTINWKDAANLELWNGAIHNLASALFNIQCDQRLQNWGWNSSGFFHNAGTVRKSAGTGTSSIGVNFTNTGVVEVQSGTLSFGGGQFGSVFNAAAGTAIQLNGGGNLTGTFTAEAGATISLGGGAFTYAPSLLFNGAGVHQLVGGSITLLNEVIPNLQLVGGTVWLSPSFQGGSITNLTLPGASLAGTNAVTGTFNCGGGTSGTLLVVGGATLNWTDGTISGELTVAQNGVLSLVGSSQKNLGGLLFNAGTINWKDAANLELWNGAIHNLASALFNIQCDQRLQNWGWNSSGFFHNAGTVRKIAGTGTSSIGVTFTNTGTVEVQSGTLSFQSCYANSPSANLAISIGDVAPGTGYGLIQFSSPPTFDGSFSVSMRNGYRPTPGDIFIVLHFPSATNSFTAMNGLDLGAGLGLQPEFTPTSLNLTAGSVPTITSHPQSLDVTNGGSASFSVTAISSTTMGYQWQRNATNLSNGSNISGASSNVLALSTATAGDAGNYRVIVTNSYGSITSSVATLTVISSPAITSQPQGLTVTNGTAAVFNVAATGAPPLDYQWQRNGTNLANGGNISGATSSALTVSATSSGDMGNYRVIVSNTYGAVTSTVASLTVIRTDRAQPMSPGSYVQNFDTLAHADTDDTSWVNGVTLPGWYGERANATAPPTTNYRVSDGSNANGGFYDFGSIGSPDRALGAITAVDARAHGVRFTNDTLVTLSNLTVSYVGEQWRNNGNTSTQMLKFDCLVGAAPLDSVDVFNTNTDWIRFPALDFASPTVGNVASALDGNQATNRQSFTRVPLTGVSVAPGQELLLRWYDVVEPSNNHALAIDDVMVTFAPPPTITSQPQSLTVTIGNPASFSVAANGTAPLAYQWQKNGANLANGGNISGATSSALALSTTAAGDAGNYRVIVSNSYGSVTSSVAVLTVVSPPSIASQPQNLTVTNGLPASFSVTANGTAPLAYQWQKNGANLADGGNISGATSSTLALSTAAAGDAGNYRVIVSNSYGSATSSVAVLTVVSPPSIASQPQNLTVTNGLPASFSVTANGTAPLAYQWQKNGANLANGGNISGATSSALALSTTAAGDAGNYRVIVSNSYGSVTSSVAVLTVVSPPSIASQPQSLTVTNGNPASFSVTANGTAPLAYQWQKNGVSLVDDIHVSGATSSLLTLGAVTTGDTGGYRVIVSNNVGAVTSVVASLTVVRTDQARPMSPGSYAQSFDTLDHTQAAEAIWIDGVTLPGWYAGQATAGVPEARDYRVSDGSSASAGFHAFGTGGSPDRALGSIASADALAHGVRFTNDTPVTISNVTVSCVGEQWRNSGQGIPQQLRFECLVAAGPLDGVDASNTNPGWMRVPALDFTSPVVGGVATALDGNQAANRQAFVNVPLTGVSVAPGQELFLRWYDAPDAGANHGLAIDDVLVTFGQAPVITSQPQSLAVTNGQPAVFRVTATADGAGPLSYQWFFNGQPLASATNAELSLPAVTRANAGTYWVVVSGWAGSTRSADATLSVLNNLPQAWPVDVGVQEDSSAAITLVGTDADGDALTYTYTAPAHGTLTGVAPHLAYAPHANYSGTDSFRYQVSDGAGTSGVATVSITVWAVNDPPVARDDLFATDQGVTLVVAAPGVLVNDGDVENTPLTARIVSPPAHGVLNLSPSGAFTYAPVANYHGPDSFSYAAWDGEAASAAATVVIQVRPSNEAPVARIALEPLFRLFPEQTNLVVLSLNKSNAVVQLDGSGSTDADNDPLDYFWYAEGAGIPFAAGVRTTNRFAVDFHTVVLQVEDGKDSGFATAVFEVMTAGDATAELGDAIAQTALPKQNSQSLLSSCRAAEDSFNRGNLISGVNQLQALQSKFRAQIAPFDPALATRWTRAAQRIIDAVQQP